MDGLFGATSKIRLTLTEAEHERVTRVIVGSGGHQLLLRDIVKLLDRAPDPLSCELDQHTLQRVHRYAESYGSGGYQDRFKAIRAAAWRAGWVQEGE